ncbi:MAG: DUF63 family protein [archaeon]
MGFLNEYFISPVFQNDVPYNIYNTPVYAIILVIAVFGLYRVMQKMKIPINGRFFFATLPYIVLAAVLRVMRDAELVKSPIYVTPLIYFLVFGITFTALLCSWEFGKLQKKIPYHYLMFLIGVMLLFGFGINMRFPQYAAALQILSYTAAIAVLLFGAYKLKPKIFTPLNSAIMLAAMFDAVSTFVGVDFYGYGEKHVLPNYLFGLAGSAWVMLPLKFIVVLGALYIIDKTEGDTPFKNFIKFAILCVTLGPGARNTLRLAMGV